MKFCASGVCDEYGSLRDGAALSLFGYTGQVYLAGTVMPIDVVNVWYPQILNYAKAITTPGLYEASWQRPRLDESTSVDSIDELMEQVFGDLDADKIMENLAGHHRDLKLPLASIQEFITALGDLESESFECQERGDTGGDLLYSTKWIRTVQAAQNLLKDSDAIAM